MTTNKVVIALTKHGIDIANRFHQFLVSMVPRQKFSPDPTVAIAKVKL
jgi:hypothetical protein